MNVLVTGGSGFIGGHLVKRLVADGHRLTLLERFSPAKKNIFERVFGTKRLTVVWADISKSPTTDYQKYFRGIDWVFHLAGQLNIFDADPLLFHRANIDATIHVLEASRQSDVLRFIYPASASCYGDAKKYPTAENAPIHLKYPYALTKYLAEQYVLHWGRVYKLPVVSLRVSNVYGLRFYQPQYWGAVTSFILQQVKGGPFQVRGSGNQSRDYIFADDVVEAFVATARSDVTNEIFNVGTAEETTINDVISILGGGEVRYIPERQEEIFRMCVDTTKIRKRLGWRPAVSFEDGLEKVLTQTAVNKCVAITDSQ